MMPETAHTLLVAALVAAGFDSGWVLQGETLVVWEHDAEPPKPLTRPA